MKETRIETVKSIKRKEKTKAILIMLAGVSFIGVGMFFFIRLLSFNIISLIVSMIIGFTLFRIMVLAIVERFEENTELRICRMRENKFLSYLAENDVLEIKVSIVGDLCNPELAELSFLHRNIGKYEHIYVRKEGEIPYYIWTEDDKGEKICDYRDADLFFLAQFFEIVE